MKGDMIMATILAAVKMIFEYIIAPVLVGLLVKYLADRLFYFFKNNDYLH